jgi:hypothetical protein
MGDEIYHNAIYVSEDEDDREDDEIAPPMAKAVRHDWRHERTFESKEEAARWITEAGCWTSSKMYDTMAGQKDFYRCNRVPQRGFQCAKAVQLLYHAESMEVTLFISAQEHTHDEILENAGSQSGINKKTKALIDRLLSQKQPPKSNLNILATESATNVNIKVPKDR